ncbi:MAG: hypothetical protein ABJP45_13310 [Cyclobacteriaceae bacterium]
MKRASWIYLIIIVVCLVITFVATYYTLGGYDKVEVYEAEGGNRTVIGRHYIGPQTSDINEVMEEIKAMVDEGRLRGQLTMVEYHNDTIGADSVHYFIGASFEEIRNILEIPSGLTYEEFTTSKIYQVFITQHPLVRPFPAEIRSLIEVRSIEDGVVLAPYTFDVYYSDGSLRTEVWVKKN